MINRVGPVFPVRAQDDTGADPAAIARAYSIAREVFALRYIWSQIEALDNRIPATVQYTAMFQTTRLLRHMSYWLLENRRNDLDIKRAVSRYAGKVTELFYELPEVLGVSAQARLSALRSQLVAQRVPEELAVRIASLEELHCALDLVEVTMVARVRIVYAAKAYFDLGERIGLTWIKEQIESLPADGHWQAVARGTLRDNLYALQARITLAVLEVQGPGRGGARRSLAVAACRGGRLAETGGGRSAHRFGAGFRDAVGRIASGQTPCPALTRGCRRSAYTARTICSSASIGKLRLQNPWGSSWNPRTASAWCCARRSRPIRITREPHSAAVCMRSRCLPDGPGRAAISRPGQLDADAVIQESNMRFLDAGARRTACQRRRFPPPARSINFTACWHAPAADESACAWICTMARSWRRCLTACLRRRRAARRLLCPDN